MIRRLLLLAAVMACSQPARAAEPLPGDACSAVNNLLFTSGPEVAGGGGHALLCQGGTWKSILSFNNAAGLTKLGNQTCSTNQILKFNGTSWACAADATGMASLPALSSANFWVGNGSNAATAVAMSGDATISNAGVLTISSNAIGSAEITDGSVANADLAGSIALSKLAVTGTANSSVFLRGDGTWAATPSGADNLGNHTATQSLAMSNYDLTGVRQITGGFGVLSTAGTLDWNDASNARSGNGMALLLGTASNGPGPSTYFYPFSFEYSAMNGTGQITQLAIPYSAAAHLDSGLFIRGRYTGGWSSWRKILTENGSGNISVTGAISASSFSGSGTALTALNATNLGSGTVAAARMPALTGDVTMAAGTTVTNIAANTVGLTELSATGTPSASSYLRGDNTWATVPAGADNLGNHIATTVLRSDTHNTDDLGTSAIRWKDGWFQGTVTAGTFAGSGASLTGLNASNLSTGTVATARLGTGTANSSVFLRGDGTWAAPPSGADNLGNHTATTSLTMSSNSIVNAGPISTGPWNATYDIWHQGGPNGASGGARNLAILGTDNDSGDTLYLNYGSEYSGGTVIGGAVSVANGLTLSAGNLSLGAGAITSSAGTVIDGAGGWHRTYGNTGWYNGTHGGGWTMEDSTWLRAYGGKGIYTTNVVRADSGVRTNQVCDVNGANCVAQSSLGGGGGGGVTGAANASCSVTAAGGATCTASCPAGYYAASAFVYASSESHPCKGATVSTQNFDCWYSSETAATIQNAGWGAVARSLYVRCLK